MPEVYLFNPDNDLALANGDENYMSPLSARKMANDLSLLPAWYALPEALVLCNEAVDKDWLQQVKDLFDLHVQTIKENEIAFRSSLKLSPWGWNATLIKNARLLGFPDNFLPDKEQMEAVRELSHRSLAVSLLRELNVAPSFCGLSEELTSDEAVREFVERYPKVLLKAPWSGSGKGLRPGKGEYTSHIQGWAHRVIKNQRCVVGEPLMDKVHDFAMEFFCDNSGKAHFAGYSFFETDVRGAYKGNLLASDEEVEQRLTKFADAANLHFLRKQLEEKLSRLLGSKYRGYLGVDMMICRFSEYPVYRIHPCVEVNLRMNMGLFSRLFYDRFISLGLTGCFSVEYFQDPSLLMEDHRQKLADYPLSVENGRITSGYLSLNPIGRQTNYRASILVEG
ncbi:hypothetical protein [uncultured Bacteroides sp.]|uniref:hypothetical protein n=1 Tax=uncultured Bacteroides sp. TaxID=162156 RepID=UPI002AAB5ED0|nr:hypothetical protein [uncultured Bacteroides sp.]